MIYISKADVMALCGPPNHVIVYVMATGLLGWSPYMCHCIVALIIYLNIFCVLNAMV